MHEPWPQFLDVADYDLLGLRVSGLVSRVDLIAGQYILHQCLATGHHQFPLRHAEVGFDNALLRGVQAAIGSKNDRYFGIPVFIQLVSVLSSVQQAWVTA